MSTSAVPQVAAHPSLSLAMPTLGGHYVTSSLPLASSADVWQRHGGRLVDSAAGCRMACGGGRLRTGRTGFPCSAAGPATAGGSCARGITSLRGGSGAGYGSGGWPPSLVATPTSSSAGTGAGTGTGRGRKLPRSSVAGNGSGNGNGSELVSERVGEAVQQALRLAGVDERRDPRLWLLVCVGGMAARKAEIGLQELVAEAAKYTTGSRSLPADPNGAAPKSWEEALMTVPDLETIPYSVVEQRPGYEVRQVQSYLVAETSMPSGNSGFDFFGTSRSFNTLAGYLFGKNRKRDAMEVSVPAATQAASSTSVAMEMTTPVVTRRTSELAASSSRTRTSGSGSSSSSSSSSSTPAGGVEMEMTTLVVTRRSAAAVGSGGGGDSKGEAKGISMEMTTPVLSSRSSPSSASSWRMSFVLPSEFDESNLPIPDDPSVAIRRIPSRTVAAAAFSGIASDDEVARREADLRAAVAADGKYRVKAAAELEVAQFNPPFMPPFLRRNEVSLEVEEVTTL